jgi:hypothetical protein
MKAIQRMRPMIESPVRIVTVPDRAIAGAASSRERWLKAMGLLHELPAPLVVFLSIGCAVTFALWLTWLA